MGMMMKNILSTKVVLAIFAIVALAVCCWQLGKTRTRQIGQVKNSCQITITDSMNRKVTIPYPVRSVAVINPYTAELITAIGAAENIKGIDLEIYSNRNAFPVKFTDKMIIGGRGESQINFEKLIKLNPQVLIIDGGRHVDKIEKIVGLFGIKVIVLKADSSICFFNNCKLLGEIFNKEKESEKLSNYIGYWCEYVNSHLKNVTPKRVYFECRRPNRAVIPGEFFNEMLRPAHAINIFSDSKSIYVSPEYIVLRNPEFIVRLSDIRDPYSCFPPTKERFKSIENEIKDRACWDYIDAVQNDKIFIYSYYSHGGAGKLIGSFYLAKYMYPELLPELDPEKIFKTWMTEYQKIPYQSGHTYQSEAR